MVARQRRVMGASAGFYDAPKIAGTPGRIYLRRNAWPARAAELQPEVRPKTESRHPNTSSMQSVLPPNLILKIAAVDLTTARAMWLLDPAIRPLMVEHIDVIAAEFDKPSPRIVIHQRTCNPYHWCAGHLICDHAM